jgi:DNA-binding transcriptional regulator YiaG
MTYTELNTMFSLKSNTVFNNALFSRAKIEGMHETMTRLYEAAFEKFQIRGQSAVARLLNTSPQRVKNWEVRGISSDGMITAEKIIGCSPSWIKTGIGEPQSMSASLVLPMPRTDVYIAEVVKLMESTDDTGRKMALGAVKAALAGHQPAKAKRVS